MQREHAAIEARGLTRRFDDFEAVRGIDLDVEAGTLFGFLGPNGSGKSTTINMLCTLLAPTSGTAVVAGCDILTDPAGVRARIGLVFQDYSLDDELTAHENLSFHGYLYGMPATTRRTRIADVLERVGLADRASSLVKTFSGGMKRRLEIARGMLHYPRVLFLDEPTLGLDPQTRASIWQYLDELRQREDMTIFMTTHYMEEAEYCDRLAIIDNGAIVAAGSPEELKRKVGGDLVTMRTEDDAAAARQLQAASAVEVRVTPDGLIFEVDNGASFLPVALREVGVAVREVSVARPSLDTVFIKLTGRAIREQHAGELDQMRMMAARHGAGRR